MAGYKSIIKGTINMVAEKAKMITENNSVRDAYDRSTTTAKCYANVAKLTVLINGEIEEQKNTFIEIGRMFYEASNGVADEMYMPLFDKLIESDKKIEEMRAELQAANETISAARSAKDIEVEITETDGKDNE